MKTNPIPPRAAPPQSPTANEVAGRAASQPGMNGQHPRAQTATTPSAMPPSGRARPTQIEAQLRGQVAVSGRHLKIDEDRNLTHLIPTRHEIKAREKTVGKEPTVERAQAALEEAGTVIKGNLPRAGLHLPFAEPRITSKARQSMSTAWKQAHEGTFEALKAAQRAALVATEMATIQPQLVSEMAQVAWSTADVSSKTSQATEAASRTTSNQPLENRSEAAREARRASYAAKKDAAVVKQSKSKINDLVLGIPEPARQTALPAAYAARTAEKAADQAANAALTAGRVATDMVYLPR